MHKYLILVSTIVYHFVLAYYLRDILCDKRLLKAFFRKEPVLTFMTVANTALFVTYVIWIIRGNWG